MEPNPDYNPQPGSGQITPERFNDVKNQSQSPYKVKGQEDKNFYLSKQDFPGDLGNKNLGHQIEKEQPKFEENPDPDKEFKGKQARQIM